MIGTIVNREIDKRRIQKRLQEGWDVNRSFILPLEEEGIPADITQAFLQLFDESNLYPFVPHELLHSATYWEEEHIEAALAELAKICHKKLPQSKSELRDIACRIDSIADFLKTLTNLPDSSPGNAS